MKFCKNLQRVVDISDPEWAPYWTNYKVSKKCDVFEFSMVVVFESRHWESPSIILKYTHTYLLDSLNLL
jgi:hypothetical protein